MIINAKNIELSFQTLLQHKIENYNNLNEADIKFIDYVYENGYSSIEVNLHSRSITKNEKVASIIDNAEIEYFNIYYYYFFLTCAIFGGFHISLQKEY